LPLVLFGSKRFQRKIWGRKRHALVDTQGNLLQVKVTGAEKSDHQGGRALFLLDGALASALPRSRGLAAKQ
jgi:putative transposase